MLRRLSYAPLILALGCLIAAPAAAQMGKAPVEHGIYMSAEGGFLGTYDIDVRGHGVAPAAAVVSTDRLLQAEHGYFGALTLGFTVDPDAMIFDRIEIGIDYGYGDESITDTVAGAQVTTLANTNATVVTVAGTTARSRLERRTIAGSIALKADTHIGGTDVTLGLVPFLRNTEEDISSVNIGAGATVARRGDVERWEFGVMAIAEPEFEIAHGVSIVGHLGAGVYGYDADGAFIATAPAVAAFNSAVRDDASGAGLRAALGAALKIELGESAVASAFARADYWSRVASADMTDQDPTNFDPSRLQTDDAWELRAGARLTFALTDGD